MKNPQLSSRFFAKICYLCNRIFAFYFKNHLADNNMIKIIESLELTSEGVRLGNKQKVHLRQGDLDGACAVYSLMMYLIILRIFTYKQVTEGNNIKRSTSKGRIIRKFLEGQDGLIRKGLDFADDIKAGLQYAAKSIVECNYISNRQETLETLKKCIDNNKPFTSVH